MEQFVGQGIQIELNFFKPDDDMMLARLARRWLVEARDQLLSEPIDRITQAPPLPTRSLSRHLGSFGEPGPPWGSVIFRPRERRKQTSLYAWSEKSWQRLITRLDERPRSVEVRLSELGRGGMPGAGDYYEVAVTADEEADAGWVRLRGRVQQTKRLTLNDWDHLAARWAAFFTDFASSVELTIAFGYVADDTTLSESRTPFELAADFMMEEVLPGGLLRGYSWITVAGPEATARMGGAEELAESGAFKTVETLGTGSTILTATERISEYNASRWEKVFQAVAPALPPGQLKASSYIVPAKLVYKDATDALWG